MSGDFKAAQMRHFVLGSSAISNAPRKWVARVRIRRFLEWVVYLEDELLEESLVLLAGLAKLGKTVLSALLEVDHDVLAGLKHLQAGLVQLVRVRTTRNRPRLIV
jgi:hypothetical protein